MLTAAGVCLTQMIHEERSPADVVWSKLVDTSNMKLEEEEKRKADLS